MHLLSCLPVAAGTLSNSLRLLRLNRFRLDNRRSGLALSGPGTALPRTPNSLFGSRSSTSPGRMRYTRSGYQTPWISRRGIERMPTLTSPALSRPGMCHIPRHLPSQNACPLDTLSSLKHRLEIRREGSCRIEKPRWTSSCHLRMACTPPCPSRSGTCRPSIRRSCASSRRPSDC